MSTSGDTVHAHHAIDYIEIAVTDIDAAKAFYASAFGWSLVDYGPDYAGIQGEGKEVGGLRRDSEVLPGGPLVILYSRTWRQASRRSRRAVGPSKSRSTRSPVGVASTSPTRPATSSPSGQIARPPTGGASRRRSPRATTRQGR